MSDTASDRRYAIAFADVAGSTRLYENVGDDRAKALIIGVQNKIIEVVENMGGVVQQVVGDEVMMRFDDVDAGVSCACEVQRAAEVYSADEGVGMSLRIGVHYGPAIIEDGRMFGDTVNVAARAVAIARGGQIIATDAVIDNLRSTPAELARRFDEVRVKGKQDALIVYDVLWRQSNVTVISPETDFTPEALPTLLLRHANMTYTLKAQLKPFTIGRDDSNDLVVVVTDTVSRQHATVEAGRDHFVLTDVSTNGTYVRTQDGETVFLRRETLPLWGKGEIALGAAPDAGSGHIVKFECT